MRSSRSIAFFWAHVTLLVLLSGIIAVAQNTNSVLLLTKQANGVAQVYIANESFTDTVRLTFNDQASSYPRFSPDGTKIAYIYLNQVWIMNADGTYKTQVTSGNSAEATWHNNGNQIIYQEALSSDEDIIRIVNIDGSDNQVLIDHPDDKDGGPKMNPANSDQVAYRYDPGNWHPNTVVMIRSLFSGTDDIIVPNDGCGDMTTYFRHDGRDIIWFESDACRGLRRVDLTTKEISTLIPANEDEQIIGVYSNDDAYIYYSAFGAWGSRVYRMKSDGTEQTLLIQSDEVWVLHDVKSESASLCLCGEANGDCMVNVGDAVYLINYIFRGGPAPVCDCAKK